MRLRPERMQVALKREISRIIQEELKDPRIGFVTITRVEVTPDLRYAKIYFSILGKEETKQEGMDGLVSATGYIRKLLGERLKVRFIPEIVFKRDDSVEYSIELEKKLKELNRYDTKESSS